MGLDGQLRPVQIRFAGVVSRASNAMESLNHNASEIVIEAPCANI